MESPVAADSPTAECGYRLSQSGTQVPRSADVGKHAVHVDAVEAPYTDEVLRDSISEDEILPGEGVVWFYAEELGEGNAPPS